MNLLSYNCLEKFCERNPYSKLFYSNGYQRRNLSNNIIDLKSYEYQLQLVRQYFNFNIKFITKLLNIHIVLIVTLKIRGFY